MDALDTILADLCEKHLLTAISVTHIAKVNHSPVSVIFQWGRLGRSGGTGRTFDEAMNQALAGMAAQEAA